MGKESEQAFLQEDIQISNKNIKGCSQLSGKCKLKSQYDAHPLEWLLLKTDTNHCLWRCGETETHMSNTWQPLKWLNTE